MVLGLARLSLNPHLTTDPQATKSALQLRSVLVLHWGSNPKNGCRATSVMHRATVESIQLEELCTYHLSPGSEFCLKFINSSEPISTPTCRQLRNQHCWTGCSAPSICARLKGTADSQPLVRSCRRGCQRMERIFHTRDVSRLCPG